MSTHFIYAQREGHIWLFTDYAGLDFNSGITFPISSKVHSYPPSNGVRLYSSSLANKNGRLRYYDNVNIPHFPGLVCIYDSNDTLLKIPDLNASIQFKVDSRYETCFLPFRGSHKTAYVYIDINPPQSTLNYIILSDTLRDGLGGVWDDSVRVVSKDSIVSIGLGCVRHANGRDWWVVTHEFLSDTFVIALFTPDTAYVVHKQGIGAYQGIFSSSYTSGAGGGVIKFDKSGNKMLRANGERLLETYDFDRCTGLLSNVKVISPPVATLGHLDAEFSPNGRFVYVTTFDSISWNQNKNRLYQYDTNDPNVNTNYYLVDSAYNSNGTPIAALMYLALAPDNKIYVNVYCGNNCARDSTYISVIQEPDLPGSACNFQFNGLYMGGISSKRNSIPHHPDYTIGPIDGSPCDTLDLDEYPPIVYSRQEINPEPLYVVYPNPAKGYLIISGQSLENIQRIQIYSVQGKLMLSAEPEWLSASQQRVHLPSLETGVYFLEVDYGAGVHRQKVWVE